MKKVDRYYVSTEKFTCQVSVLDDTIVDTAPILHKWKNRRFSTFKQHAKNVYKDFKLEKLDGI